MSLSDNLKSELNICNIKIGLQVKGDSSQFFNGSSNTKRYKIKKYKKICFTKYNNHGNSIHVTGIKSYSDIEKIKNILPFQIIKSEIHTSLSKIIYPYVIPQFTSLPDFFKCDNSFLCDNSNMHLGYFNSLILKSSEFPTITICLFPKKAIVFSKKITDIVKIKIKLDECLNRFYLTNN